MSVSVDQKMALPVNARPRYSFQVPEKARLFGAGDPSSFVLQPITIDEEASALRTAEVSKQLAYELCKQSIVSADGKVLDWTTGDREKLFARMSPPVRQLMLKAFDRIHNPPEEVTTDFFASMTAEA